MSVMRVGISHDFFARGLNDYADWHWAWIRELAQNGVDCGASSLHFKIYNDAVGDTVAVCWNDGPPMSQEVLLDKFLCLGGTTKTFEGTTGGFGIAKTVIALAHKSYKIETGEYCVVGSGGEFELTEQEPFDGTKTTVVMAGDHTDQLTRQAKKWIKYAQCKTAFTVNGSRYVADMKKGSPRRDLGFGKVYSNKQDEYRMIVRINGMPMFVEDTSFDRLVIVELKGQSAQVMTSNRDGLVRPYSGELQEFVTELAVDKRSALKTRRGPRYTEYRGTKLCHHSQINVAEVVAGIVEEDEEDEHPGYDFHVTDGEGEKPDVVEVEKVVDETPESGPVTGITIYDEEDIDEGDEEVELISTAPSGFRRHAAAFSCDGGGVQDRRRVATLGHNFILKNETDLKVPRYYDPGSGELSSYSTKLIRFWGRIMLEIHRLWNYEAEFSIGFIFDEGELYATEAECENGDYGLVYYLNPCVIVEQTGSYSKSFKKRYKLTERDRLIMNGVHEFVHATGLSWHDETYANRLTDYAAFAMKHRKRFNWCFR